VASISEWTIFRLVLVGTLCHRNLDQYSLILVSTGLRLLAALGIICRYSSYADALVVGLVVRTRQLLLVMPDRIKGGWVMSGVSLIVVFMAWRVWSMVAAASVTAVFRVMMTSLSARGWGLGTIVSGTFFFFFCSTVVDILLTVNRPLPWRTLSAQDRFSGICVQGQSGGEGSLVGAGGFWP
jgi:hypothetical protein